ncbi:MAG: CDP-diacylglycerol--glycerol-3-phosphate 3-phosphatidyltransferase [Candidatus Methylomirabilales bacterium]
MPFVMVFLIAPDRPSNYPALIVFLAAVLTDLLDGHIARRTRQVTTLGKLLDPIADKLLIASALVSLVQVGRVPAWMVVLVVGRDLAVTGLRGIAASRGIIIAASEWGKLKMGAEVLAISLLILNADFFRVAVISANLGHLSLGVAVCLGIASGMDYFHKFWHRVNVGP